MRLFPSNWQGFLDNLASWGELSIAARRTFLDGTTPGLSIEAGQSDPAREELRDAGLLVQTGSQGYLGVPERFAQFHQVMKALEKHPVFENAGLKLATWFQPSVSILRPKTSPFKDSVVIHRGDMLHCDMGIVYLGLCTDTQQLAYVLKDGETDAPKGLREGLAKGNRLQDILMAEFREGRTGNDILAAALKKAKESGLRPSIYSHPLGVHGHAASPTIGLWDRQNGVPGAGDYPLFAKTCYSIELNVMAAVPEWDGQDVQFALEQDAVFDRNGPRFLDVRQTSFHLVR